MKCDIWCWLGPLLLTMVLAVAAGSLVYAFSQRKQKMKLEKQQQPLLPSLKNDPENAVPSFAPMEGAFVIPFAQLEVGQVIAAGAQGQIRKGIFSGKAVAIKELLAVMFDPDETNELAVCTIE